MRRLFVPAAAAALALGVAACRGYGGSSPTTPDNASVPPPGAAIVDVVGINGGRSFSPSPATVGAGQLVVWHNVDSITHRVVFNDGEVDTGNLAPGAFSQPMALVAPGPYHCSIHPEMVGTTVGR